ncbi:MAG: Phosphoglycerate mutase [Marmoricola sp.]|nr:Phosphoglycerate mutase [Marmoricola sp.]
MSFASVVIEADGGSRGNPGLSAYGAVLKDAATGEVIAERAEAIGVTTNNVAEYRGLIAGLELAAEHAPDAGVEVRMDSKLVVEQMSGNWKVKHPSMRPLAAQAQSLAPIGTTYTWVPREQNKHADRLANEALDGFPVDSTNPTTGARSTAGNDEEKAGYRGWSAPGAPPTTLILVRHGVTDHTLRKLFSGGLASSNPPLNDEGKAQARATAEWLAPMRDQIDALVSSPVRRTQESAEIIGEVLGKPIEIEPGIAEMEFGSWDGLTFVEVQEKYPDDLSAWLGNIEYAPGGGESFVVVQERVLAGRDRLVKKYAGKTIVVVSHVTPIKAMVVDALKAPLLSVYRMELAPASVTVISYFDGGPDGDEPMANMRLFNARPTETAFLDG